MSERVAVLMGGNTAEREVSLCSGNAVVAALRTAGVDAHPVDTAHFSPLQLPAQRFDKAFIALHGRGGEDGTLQALLEQMHIPYTGSGVMASAIAIDKIRTKLLWRGAGLPTADFVWLNRNQYHAGLSETLLAQIAALGLPLFVKPNSEGSSVGISKISSLEQLSAALETAFRYDSSVLLEAFIGGGEYTIAIVGERTLPCVRIEVAGEFYDYEAKYLSADTRYYIPSGLSVAHETAMAALAQQAWQVLDGRGWGRIDVMMESDGRLQLLEANTSPGMTSHSLVPMAAKEAGISFTQLVEQILQLAV